MQQMQGGGRQDNDEFIPVLGGSDFLPKPSPPVAMTPAGMARLQEAGFGGGFQSQRPQNLRAQQMQAAGGMFGSRGRGQFEMQYGFDGKPRGMGLPTNMQTFM